MKSTNFTFIIWMNFTSFLFVLFTINSSVQKQAGKSLFVFRSSNMRKIIQTTSFGVLFIVLYSMHFWSFVPMIMLSSLLLFERLSKNPVDENKNLSLFLLMMFIGVEMQLLKWKCLVCLFPCGFILGSWHSGIKKHVGKKSALSI